MGTYTEYFAITNYNCSVSNGYYVLNDPFCKSMGVKKGKSYAIYKESYHRRLWVMLANILGGNTEFDYSPAEYTAAFGQTVVAKIFGPISFWFGQW